MKLHPPEWSGSLSAGDFPCDPVIIRFEDGSLCSFEYAFYRVEGQYSVVYTEHCGYHSFYGAITPPLPITGTNFTAFKTVEEMRKKRNYDD
jgi:hypothetical protein